MRPSRHETAAPVPSLASPGRAGAHPPTRSLAPSLGARPEPRTPPRLCAGVLPLYNRHTRPYLPKALNPPPYGGSSNPTFARALALWLDSVLALYGDHILPVDVASARRWGRLSNVLGHDGADLLIAATALEHGLTVVTRNVRHFEPAGVKVLDPFGRRETP